jgi:hypothetical protein
MIPGDECTVHLTYNGKQYALGCKFEDFPSPDRFQDAVKHVLRATEYTMMEVRGGNARTSMPEQP